MSELIKVYVCHAKINASGESYNIYVTSDLETALAYNKDRNNESDMCCTISEHFVGETDDSQVVISKKLFEDMVDSIKYVRKEAEGCYCQAAAELNELYHKYNGFQ